MHLPSRLTILRASCAAGLLIVANSSLASPPTDDCSAGHGCIMTSDGTQAQFEYFAEFDIDAYGYVGNVSYTDAAIGLEVHSNNLVDYADFSAYSRAFAFSASASTYNEIRLIVTDNGPSLEDDHFEIQLLQNGNIVYHQAGPLEADCGGGIAISQECSTTPGGGGGGTTGGGGGTTGDTTGGSTGGTPPPDRACDDFVTGGGWIIGTPSGAKANFGVHGGIKKNGLWGGLNYIDHGSRMHVKSTETTAYIHLTEVGRQINFNVTIDGVPGTAVVKVYDNGEPGRDDVFEITLSNGYHASGDLGGPGSGGGNLQLHKSKCDKGDKEDKEDKEDKSGKDKGGNKSKGDKDKSNCPPASSGKKK